MYIGKSLMNGLKILGFDKEAISDVAREKSLEEIFLSTLFFNYMIVLIVFFVSLVFGGVTINGRDLNENVFFGLLMIYPFVYNLIVYGVYALFGGVSELLQKAKTVKPLISVGFHVGIVYAIVLAVVGFAFAIDVMYGLFLFVVFLIYFLLTMFLAISTLYKYSFNQTLIILFIPILIFVVIVLLLGSFVDMSIIGKLLFLN